MKDKKRALMLHSLYDHTGIARYLEEQAARGWQLEKLGQWGWVFRRAEPKRLHYAVTYCPKASVYDPGPSEDQQVLQDYCAAAGWELVTTNGQMQIFVSEAENPPPVETDPAVQVSNIHQAMRRSFLPSYLVLMVLSGFLFAMLVWQLWTDPIDLLTSTSNFFTAFFWTLLFVLCLVEVLGYLRWHRRAKLAARDGQLSCSIYFMDTADESEGPAYTATQGSMLLLLDWQTDSRVVAVFDTYIAVLDPRTATETARYDFGGATLQSAAPGMRQTALLLNIRGGNSLVTFDSDLTLLAEIPARQAYGVTATDTDIYLLCPNAVECYSYDGVQNWAREDLAAHPQAVLDAAQLLVFTGSSAEVLAPPAS